MEDGGCQRMEDVSLSGRGRPAVEALPANALANCRFNNVAAN